MNTSDLLFPVGLSLVVAAIGLKMLGGTGRPFLPRGRRSGNNDPPEHWRDTVTNRRNIQRTDVNRSDHVNSLDKHYGSGVGALDNVGHREGPIIHPGLSRGGSGGGILSVQSLRATRQKIEQGRSVQKRQGPKRKRGRV